MANLETWLAEENAIIQKNEKEKQVYLYDWLQRLEEYLISSNQGKEVELKKVQGKIIATLHKIVEINCSPATRHQLASCFATIYNTGTTLGLFDSVTKYLELIKNRDESPTYLPIKISAICCTGEIYGRLGRMVGTLYEAALSLLLKLFYKAEAQMKCEILLCMEKMLRGMSNAAQSGFKDIAKVCKSALSDRSMPVRWSAAKCANELCIHADFVCTSDLYSMVSACLKGLEGSDYDVRVQVAALLGHLAAASQNVQLSPNSKLKKVSVEDMFSIMASAFLKGVSGFLKSGNIEAGLNREIRVGVTQAYVVFFREMGAKWVTKYLAGIIIHILELLANHRSTASHIDAVYSRKCVSFILNSILCGMLPEAAKIQAAKELCKIVTKQMDSIHETVTQDQVQSEMSADVRSTLHVLVCALTELSNLVLALTSSVATIMNDVIVAAIFSTLIHPAPAVWLTAAWCVRSCCVALPSNMTHLLDLCMKKMRTLRSSPAAVMGYGYTLAAIVGGLYLCPLGIPYKKAKDLCAFTEDILKKPGTSGKLAVCRVQTGWVMMGALCTLGPSFNKCWLKNMIELWTWVLPVTTSKDVEKGKGTVKSWQLTLENRACALCAMWSFVKNCKQLLTSDVMKKIMLPVGEAINALSQFQMLLKNQGPQLRSSITMYKTRLYTLLRLIHPSHYQGQFTSLLRNLASDFTLVDQGSVTTSLLQSLCHKDDSILLGSWLQDTDYRDVEEQLQLNSAAGSGALEHDSLCIYSQAGKHGKLPGPLPLGVAVVDSAIHLFGQLFPFIPNKHCTQLMSHFNDCISKNKGARQQAIQTNIFTAFLAALKNMSENKSSFADVRAFKDAKTLVEEALGNTDKILRCAAGEALGRLTQVMNDAAFVAQTAQDSFDKCQKTPDATVRTGHALALGCLHRYVGGMGSGQHLRNSIAILIALSKDSSSSMVQTWALHGLTSIADSGGPMFRSFVDQSLSTVINLLLSTPSSSTQVHRCLGKCTGALITAIGPELQDESKHMWGLRTTCLCACAVMQHHPDAYVQAEAIRCLQQINIFAPNLVNLSTLVPHLCRTLLSPHLLLRKASVECLRQLAHREAEEISELCKGIVEKNSAQVEKKMYMSNYGLEGLLFSMLDSEVEVKQLKHIREVIMSMLQALAATQLHLWLNLIKQVLLASHQQQEKPQNSTADGEEEDGEEGKIVLSSAVEKKLVITPKWETRVFAMHCLRAVFDVCCDQQQHMDLKLAREMKEKHPEREFLVMQLAELVRMAFIAGTSPNNLLKLEGMEVLQGVVTLFAASPDPDIEGHLILEQFQAQVGTALRPAFAENVPPDVTAMACEVCSSWIGRGISRDVSDVRRIQQLLVNSLGKIGQTTDNQLYSESAYTLENLAVLKAWAQIYIMAITESEEEGRLYELIERDLNVLVKHWIGAIRDFVLLNLPPQYDSYLPNNAGTFYSMETAEAVKGHYKQSWPPIIHAVALWLAHVPFTDPTKAIVGAVDESAPVETEKINSERFHLVAGVCIEAMFSPLSTYPSGTIDTCTNTINALMTSSYVRTIIATNKKLCMELVTVLHRLLLSRDEIAFQQLALSIVKNCQQALHENKVTEEEIGANKSVVFCVLEIFSYTVKKYAHQLMPDTKPVHGRKIEFNVDVLHLLSSVCTTLLDIPDICTIDSTLVCLPTIMYLTTTVIRYLSMNASAAYEHAYKQSFAPILRGFKKLITHPHSTEADPEKWSTLIQSCLYTIVQPILKNLPEYGCENLLLLVSVFLLYADITNTTLINSCAKVFSNVVQNTSQFKLCTAAVKILHSIFGASSRNVSVLFIGECVPSIVGVLEGGGKPACDAQLSCCKESATALEILLSLVDNDKKSSVMSIYVQCLVGLLHDTTSLGRANSFSRALHDTCIQRLTAVGPLYPAAFKSVMGSMPHLKVKLTEAIKANQGVKSVRAAPLFNKNSPAHNAQNPQIKLKMDFSNFK